MSRFIPTQPGITIPPMEVYDALFQYHRKLITPALDIVQVIITLSQPAHFLELMPIPIPTVIAMLWV